MKFNKKELVKSPLNYTGGKFKLLPQILPLFPEKINTFVDLFCGGGNVGMNVPSNKVVLNDINKEALDVLQWFNENNSHNIVNEIINVIHEYNLSETNKNGYEYYGCNSNSGVASYNKEKYLKLRSDYNNGRKDVVTFYTMLIYAFNNQIRFNDKGEFNIPVNKRDFNSNLQKNLVNFVDRMKEKTIRISNNDFRKLKINKLKHNDFVYLDPPYLITTASYNESDGWNEKLENNLYILCDQLNDKGIKFAMSNVTYHKGKTNDSLIEWSRKYKINELNYTYKNSNYQTKDRSDNGSVEVLITNY